MIDALQDRFNLDKELDLLKRALLSLNRGAFLFAICDSGEWRERLMARLEKELVSEGKSVLKVDFSPTRSDLTGEIRRRLEALSASDQPKVVFINVQGMGIAGLEEIYPTEETEKAWLGLRSLNYQREQLSRLGLPLVFWMNWETFRQAYKYAGDLLAARSGLFCMERVALPAYVPLEVKQALQWMMEHPMLTALSPKELRRRVEHFEAQLQRVRSKEKLNQPLVALLYSELATLYRNLGELFRALEFQEKAVNLYRTLARKNPGAFLPDLAASLNNLGAVLSALGRREEALGTTQEAVGRYRELAQRNPDAFLPYLAGSLNNLGMMLSALGRREEALRVTQEAVEIHRELAQENPDAFLPDLAGSLNNLGAMLSALGRREEALEATQEAVGHYRELAQKNPDAFLPYLARSLGTYGWVLMEMERYDEAADAFEEGIRLLTPFYQRLPRVFEELMSFLIQFYSEACRAAGRALKS